MKKLLIVSNRLPVTVAKNKGKFSFERSVGGLTTGVSSLEIASKQLWIGWPGITVSGSADSKTIRKKLLPMGYHPVFLTERDIEEYYHGFCNETLWPLFHYFVQYAIYDESFWNAYVRVNKAFCDAIIQVAGKDDVIWIHDYQLMLLPMLLRKKLPGAKIGFFLHIPFPSSEIFRLMPWSGEILQGLVGSDLIGFHTFDYARHFLESIRRVLGYEHTLGQLTVGNRAVKVDTFPMGIDYDRFSAAPQKPEVKEKVGELRKGLNKNYKVILSIDRLDYTKGIPQRLRAYDLFLKQNPKYIGKVILILVAVPSRVEVERYKVLKQTIDNLVGKINGKYGTLEWAPIRYLYRSFEFNDLVALYSVADVLFLTPIRDGMNLIAKEYIASKSKGRGVLILGEMAGTAKELGEALIINPNDEIGTAGALKQAIEMAPQEQNTRLQSMRSRLGRYDVGRWANDFMERLKQVKEVDKQLVSRSLTTRAKKDLVKGYRKSQHRLILLDYDGTLMPFNEKPERVKPDNELVAILKALKADTGNRIVIISGRDRKTLNKWVGEYAGGLVAEHGVWIKEKSWRTIETLTDEWKSEIRPILEIFVDRTPGSFVEEKDFSLVWHFRKVDPALAVVRVGELKDILHQITSNLNVGVLEGNKVIEVKNTGVNKGRATQYWVGKRKWDFILAVGDDATDEDIFEVLPERAFSIKVGFGASKARFNVPGVKQVRELLRALAKN